MVTALQESGKPLPCVEDFGWHKPGLMVNLAALDWIETNEACWSEARIYSHVICLDKGDMKHVMPLCC